MYQCVHEGQQPCSYELSLLKERPGIIVSVSPNALLKLESELSTSSTMVQSLQSRGVSSEFVPPSSSAWGFSEVLVPADCPYSNWSAWSCSWPHALDLSSRDCTSLREIAFTLVILFESLMFIDETESNRFQLLECQLDSGGDSLGRWGLWAGVSAPMVQWLLTFPVETVHQQATDGMLAAWRHMTGDTDCLETSLTCAKNNHPGAVLLRCPGNACDLAVDGNEVGRIRQNCERDVGYVLTPHNMDAPVQQLTLLTGLACLYEQARKAIQTA